MMRCYIKKIYVLTAIISIAMVFVSCTKESNPSSAGGSGSYMVQFQQNMLPTTSGRADDTYITDAAPATNYGACDYLYVGRTGGYTYRTLFSAQLKPYIPVGAKITGAYLAFTIHTIGTQNITLTAQVVDKYWFMNTGSCSGMADPLDGYTATWNSPWSAAGADFEAAPAATPVARNYYSADNTYTFKLDKDTVQAWLDSSNTNYGILIKAENESTVPGRVTLFSGDNVNLPNYRPVLTVYYSI